MGRRKKFGRAVDGVLVVNKRAGATSNAVLQRAKRLFFASKAGHTGALDPLATGVLPLCFGESTKFSQYLLDSDKGYQATICLGVTTDSADADGVILCQQDASHITEQHVRAAMAKYQGDIEQVPPMYSALKVDGQPLYKLARAGIEIERKPRPVHIFDYQILSFSAGEQAELVVSVLCSKGTYIRSLAADLGEDLGVGGHIVQLHRTRVGEFVETDAYDLDVLEAERGDARAETLDHYLLPVDAPIQCLPKLVLNEDSGFYFLRGQAVMDTQVYALGDEGDTVRVFAESDRFLGVGEITDDGRVAPKRLVAS